MVTSRTLSHWVKISNLKLQFLLLALVLVTVGTRIIPLEMQKRIVNEAIDHKDVRLLLEYCGLYLAAVVSANLLKYSINVLQTYIGEQALARLRKELYAHILTLPLSFFRKASPGMVVSSLSTEVAAVGDFIGQAVAVPSINILSLLAYTGYMFYLNPLLALMSVATTPLIILFIPRLQRKANSANKSRVDINREYSTKIGEAISGMHEIHGNGSYRIENRKCGELVDQLLKIRVVWTLYRQGIKALNNFFQSLGPFVLFLAGGYLAIGERLDLGALVAFLSTYEKLYDPWKELMDFYQGYQDAGVRYKRVMEYFDGAPEHLIETADRKARVFEGAITAKDVTFEVAGGIRLLKGISLDLKPGRATGSRRVLREREEHFRPVRRATLQVYRREDTNRRDGSRGSSEARRGPEPGDRSPNTLYIQRDDQREPPVFLRSSDRGRRRRRAAQAPDPRRNHPGPAANRASLPTCSSSASTRFYPPAGTPPSGKTSSDAARGSRRCSVENWPTTSSSSTAGNTSTSPRWRPT